MIQALSECKARLAYTIVITNCPEKIFKADYVIKIIDDDKKIFSSFLSVMVF